MKYKTSEASGPVLNWMVATALGRDPKYNLAGFGTVFRGWWLTKGGEYERMPSYSTDWALGGPIIEREKISVIFYDKEWRATNGTCVTEEAYSFLPREAFPPKWDRQLVLGWGDETAPTLLVAAMRCYVASKLGDEVEVPDGLI